MSLERIWAAWRSEYIERIANESPVLQDNEECLFERLAREDPKEALVLARNEHAFAVMNLYPYTSGHLMVAPFRHVPTLADLRRDEAAAVMTLVQDASVAISTAYCPDGLNVGANIGRAAGAGVPGHVHLHVLPRWTGDTNFMTAVADVRVLPESMRTGWEKLTAAWPS